MFEFDVSIDLNFPANVLIDKSLVVHHFEHFLNGAGSVDNVGVTVRNSRSCVCEVVAV